MRIDWNKVLLGGLVGGGALALYWMNKPSEQAKLFIGQRVRAVYQGMPREALVTGISSTGDVSVSFVEAGVIGISAVVPRSQVFV